MLFFISKFFWMSRKQMTRLIDSLRSLWRFKQSDNNLPAFFRLTSIWCLTFIGIYLLIGVDLTSVDSAAQTTVLQICGIATCIQVDLAAARRDAMRRVFHSTRTISCLSELLDCRTDLDSTFKQLSSNHFNNSLSKALPTLRFGKRRSYIWLARNKWK